MFLLVVTLAACLKVPSGVRPGADPAQNGMRDAEPYVAENATDPRRASAADVPASLSVAEVDEGDETNEEEEEEEDEDSEEEGVEDEDNEGEEEDGGGGHSVTDKDSFVEGPRKEKYRGGDRRRCGAGPKGKKKATKCLKRKEKYDQMAEKTPKQRSKKQRAWERYTKNCRLCPGFVMPTPMPTPPTPVPKSGCAPGEVLAGDACLPSGSNSSGCPSGYSQAGSKCYKQNVGTGFPKKTPPDGYSTCALWAASYCGSDGGHIATKAEIEEMEANGLKLAATYGYTNDASGCGTGYQLANYGCHAEGWCDENTRATVCVQDTGDSMLEADDEDEDEEENEEEETDLEDGESLVEEDEDEAEDDDDEDNEEMEGESLVEEDEDDEADEEDLEDDEDDEEDLEDEEEEEEEA